MKRFLLLISLIAMTSTGLAKSLPNNVALCPPANQLRKDPQNLWWATQAVHNVRSTDPHSMIRYKWYSTSPSLAEGIDHFSGAQYIGTTEGHVICVYKPTITFNTQSFPVLVYFETLSLQPKNSNWKSDPRKPGVKNCISENPRDCPYQIYQPEVIADPYESLRELG